MIPQFSVNDLISLTVSCFLEYGQSNDSAFIFKTGQAYPAISEISPLVHYWLNCNMYRMNAINSVFEKAFLYILKRALIKWIL